ncbi:hypothetical protein BS333_14880 [Vibrio azureus]|uniref:Uncharacterized protein n=1 Tax=Vibrio azureus NBRC 104587 TaxID=1219077 RepID=U3A9R9_9VIBR|nr:hypothetical protein BS333_14880 [Vibrio azureus]GAD76681.1 hypothetical protein VAZ01S_049_00460 [Vibrio azureus NBRC 104587]
MIFTYNDGFYKLARITGPCHNLLCIKLSNVSVDNIIMTPVGAEQPENITADEVHKQVIEGLQYINEHFPLKFHVSEVQYLPSDTYSRNVYRKLIIEIARRILLESTD